MADDGDVGRLVFEFVVRKENTGCRLVIIDEIGRTNVFDSMLRQTASGRFAQISPNPHSQSCSLHLLVRPFERLAKYFAFAFQNQ